MRWLAIRAASATGRSWLRGLEIRSPTTVVVDGLLVAILCDARQPTISMVIPMKNKIIASMKVIQGDSELVRNVKSAISQDVEKRYEDIQDFLLESTALDPRFRSLPMLDEHSRDDVFKSLVQKATTSPEAMQAG